MRFLLEASRNYRVAAAVIDLLRIRFAEVAQDGKNPFVMRRIPVEDFIVMKKQPDDFRAVGVNAFVAGISASVIIVEKAVAEIAGEHVIDA